MTGMPIKEKESSDWELTSARAHTHDALQVGACQARHQGTIVSSEQPILVLRATSAGMPCPSATLGGFFRKCVQGDRSRIALPPQLERQVQEAAVLLFTTDD